MNPSLIDSAPRFSKTRLAIAALMLAAPQAYALEWTYGDVNVGLDTKLSAGMAFRMEKRADNLVGVANGGSAFSTNGDDGNLAYENGDVVSGLMKVTSDFTLTWKDYGIFTRASAGWNGALDNKDFFDENDYGPTKQFGQDVRIRKQKNVQKHIGHYADLLDAYAFTTQTVLGQAVALRVGQQVINWGESTFVQNGLNSILAVNANRLRAPGFDIEEVIIPSNNVWVSAGLGGGLNLEAFYQLRWERTIIDAAGSFWSTNDFAGIGGTAANLGFGRADENSRAFTPCSAPPVANNQCVPVGSVVPRDPDVTPGNDGQYGAAIRGSIAALNEMEIALYGANYHSRLPVFSGKSRAGGGLTPSTTASYSVEYPEDIRLYGISFNTVLPFDLSIQGEYSYKQGQPLQIDDVELLLAGLGAPSQINPVPGATLGGQYIRGWRRHEVSQGNIGLTRIFGPSQWLGSDQITALMEAAITHVHDLPEQSVLRYEGPGTFTPGDARTAASQGLPQQKAGYATSTSWGYKLVARAEYNNVLNIVNLRPTLRFDHDVEGISPTPISNFVANRRQVTASLGFTYGQNLSGEMGYTTYFGGRQQNLLRDRDFLDVSLKYAF